MQWALSCRCQSSRLLPPQLSAAVPVPPSSHQSVQGSYAASAFVLGIACGLSLAAPRCQTCAQGLTLPFHVQARGYQEEDSAGQTNVFAVEVCLTALSW